MVKHCTLILILSFTFFLGAITLFPSGQYSVYGLREGIILKDPGSFYDETGKLNIIGVIDNNGEFPADVTVGVNVTETASSLSTVSSDGASSFGSSITSTISGPTYSKLIYPGTGAPFKIVLSSDSIESVSQPFIYSTVRKEKANFDVLELNYSNMATGSDRALVGFVRNKASFPVYNATVFASVHDSDQAQIDSATTKAIPKLEPGQQIQIKLVPDLSVRSNAVYYSCAGVDLDAPITTVATSDGGFIPFDLQAIAKIIDLKYDDKSKSLVFGVDHYNPEGGMITLKLPQVYDDQKLTVIMDGSPHDDVKMTQDGKTIKMDIFIPPNEHQIQIKGITHVT